jgi:hypothetical protein
MREPLKKAAQQGRAADPSPLRYESRPDQLRELGADFDGRHLGRCRTADEIPVVGGTGAVEPLVPV